MKFEKACVSREGRYSLGLETESGLHYAAIPVSKQLVDYQEYYKLTNDEFENFIDRPSAALQFIDSCRNREQDSRLFMQPGSDRGVPR